MICSHFGKGSETMMALRLFCTEFSSLLVCFAAAYVWLLVA